MTIKVNVTAYATLKKYMPQIGIGEFLTLEVGEGAKLKDIYHILSIPEEEVKQTFINGLRADDHAILKEGDRIAIFPPVAGG